MHSQYIRKILPYRTIQGYTVVLSDRDQMFLNQTGTAIWNLLSEKTSVKPIADALASRFSSGQTSFPRVLFDVETFLETLYQRGLVLKDGVDNPRPSPELNGSPEKSDSDQNAPTARPVIRSVQEECMTPDLQKETRSVADYVEKLYWEKSYIYKMHVELTYRCNFKCVQCYNTTHKGAEKELSLPEWESALQQLADLGSLISRASDILIAAIAVARGRLLSLVEPRKRRPRAAKSSQ